MAIFGVDMKSNAWIFVNRQIAKRSQIMISVVKQTSFKCMPKLSIRYTVWTLQRSQADDLVQQHDLVLYMQIFSSS